MYYVIKRQTSPSQCFIGFEVVKYIASKNNEHVIFEFEVNSKAIRKWIKKEDIVLLTEDKDFFTQTMNQFKAVEKEQQALVNKAKKQLDLSMETFTKTVNDSINQFNEIKNASDVPCVLNNL